MAKGQERLYPIMQNPGIPGIFETAPQPKKHTLIIQGATLVNPNGYDEKVMLYKNGDKRPTQEDELQALRETTLPSFNGKIK